MKSDLKESLMVVARGNMSEYRELRKTGVEDFIVRYDNFITELHTNGR